MYAITVMGPCAMVHTSVFVCMCAYAITQMEEQEEERRRDDVSNVNSLIPLSCL